MEEKYKGNKIGSSKSKGIFQTYDEGGSEMKLLQYGTFLKGSAPLVTKDINSGEPLERDGWFKLYTQTSEVAVQRRIDDVKRITKFIATPKGVLWESRMAALETIQQNLQQKTSGKIKNIQDRNLSSGDTTSFLKRALNSVKNFGKSALRGVGLTASTLAQVGVSGTGAHMDTYISRAYLTDGGGGTLNQLLSYAGITNGGGLNGAEKVLGGATDVLGEEPWKHIPDEKKLVPESAIGNRGEQDYYGISTPSFLSKYLKDSQDTKNYLGEKISTGSAYLETELHGVSKANQSSMTERPVHSGVQKSDTKDLGNRYGDVKSIDEEDLFRTDPRKTTGISKAKPVSRDISQTPVERVARLYDGYTAKGNVKSGESDDHRYIKTPSIGTDNRLSINRETGSVRTLYDFDSVEENGYLKTNTDSEEYFRNKKDVFELKKNQKEVDATVTVSSKTKKKHPTTTRDEIYSMVYESEEPDYVVESDISWKDHPTILQEFSLIPFCITTITPEHRTYLYFPAYLETYEDSYTGDWDSQQYIGRAEKFYGYKGFSRSISLSFKVIAKQQKDIIPLYRKLNRLAGATAPSYGGDQALFMRGTLASLSIGSDNSGYGADTGNGLLNNQLGFIPNVKFSWDKDDPWEIDSKTYRVPYVLGVSMTFTPIEKEEIKEDYGAFFVFNPQQSTQEPEPPEQVNSLPNTEEIQTRTVMFDDLMRQVPIQRDNTMVYTGVTPDGQSTSPVGRGGGGGGIS